jgi:hypothetical protein
MKSGYVLASVEGRVAVEYFDSGAESQAKRYAFKVIYLEDRFDRSIDRLIDRLIE